MTHQQIIERLEAIEADIAERQQEWEQVAEEKHRTARDYALRLARVKLQTKGSTETEKKDKALDAIAAAPDDLYQRMVDAEGRYEGLKAAMGALEERATINMSLLKSSTRETGPQPQWSDGGAIPPPRRSPVSRTAA